MEKTNHTHKHLLMTDQPYNLSSQTGCQGPEDNSKKVSAFKNTITFETDPPELSTNVKTPKGGMSHIK